MCGYSRRLLTGSLTIWRDALGALQSCHDLNVGTDHHPWVMRVSRSRTDGLAATEAFVEFMQSCVPDLDDRSADRSSAEEDAGILIGDIDDLHST